MKKRGVYDPENVSTALHDPVKKAWYKEVTYERRLMRIKERNARHTRNISVQEDIEDGLKSVIWANNVELGTLKNHMRRWRNSASHVAEALMDPPPADTSHTVDDKAISMAVSGLCETCSTCVSEYEVEALRAMEFGTKDEILEAHRAARGTTRWDAEFNGDPAEFIRIPEVKHTLAPEKLRKMVTEHKPVGGLIKKEVPTGALYGRRRDPGLWVGNVCGWKLGTDLISSLDEHGRDIIDAVSETFYHEYGDIARVARHVPISETEIQVQHNICEWLEHKNMFDADMARCYKAMTNVPTFWLLNKLYDTPNYHMCGNDGSERGTILQYMKAGTIHDGVECFGDLAQGELGSIWVSGGKTAAPGCMAVATVVCAYETQRCTARSTSEGYSLADWLWVIGNGRHRGYTCVKESFNLCSGWVSGMVRMYNTLMEGERSEVVMTKSQLGLYDLLVELFEFMRNCSMDIPNGERNCVSYVRNIAVYVQDARAEGVHQELLYVAMRAGLDYGMRTGVLFRMVLGSMYYETNHGDRTHLGSVVLTAY